MGMRRYITMINMVRIKKQAKRLNESSKKYFMEVVAKNKVL